MELLKQYLLMGQSVTLIYPRRYGKTSLVLQALGQLKKSGHYTAFIDIFSNPTLAMISGEIAAEVLENHGLKNGFRKLQKSVTELMRNVKPKTTIDDFSYILEFAGGEEKDPWALFSHSLDREDAFAERHDKQMICAFDIFGELSKFEKNEEIIKLVRSKIQFNRMPHTSSPEATNLLCSRCL